MSGPPGVGPAEWSPVPAPTWVQPMPASSSVEGRGPHCCCTCRHPLPSQADLCAVEQPPREKLEQPGVSILDGPAYVSVASRGLPSPTVSRAASSTASPAEGYCEGWQAGACEVGNHAS